MWLDFDPQAGFEQADRRPAIVLTDRAFNDKTTLCIVCPITTKVKGRPFSVAVPPACRVEGVILVEHVKSLDWYERRCEFIVAAPTETLNAVLDVLADLLEM